MKTLAITAALALAIAVPAGSASAQECLPFASGEILCDDGTYLYYWSPAIGQWQVVDPQSAAPGHDAGGENADVVYGSGGSLTTTDDGCTMFSSPGYSFGESLSFSSGC